MKIKIIVLISQKELLLKYKLKNYIFKLYINKNNINPNIL